MKIYHISINDSTEGPFSLEELKGMIEPDTMVWREGIEWTKASELKELSSLFNTSHKAGTSQTTKQNNSTKKEPAAAKSSPGSTLLGMIVLYAGLAFFLNWWPFNKALPDEFIGAYINNSSGGGSQLTLNEDKTFSMSGLGKGKYKITSSSGSSAYDWIFKLELEFDGGIGKEYGNLKGDVHVANSTNNPICQLLIEGQTFTYYKASEVIEEVSPDPVSEEVVSTTPPQTEAAITDSAAPASTPGLYPQGSERLLQTYELSAMSKEDLKIMRNEIFARHGYIFTTDEMKQYFGSQKWYRPLYTDVNSLLTQIEKSNIEAIKKYE